MRIVVSSAGLFDILGVLGESRLGSSKILNEAIIERNRQAKDALGGGVNANRASSTHGHILPCKGRVAKAY